MSGRTGKMISKWTFVHFDRTAVRACEGRYGTHATYEYHYHRVRLAIIRQLNEARARRERAMDGPRVGHTIRDRLKRSPGESAEALSPGTAPKPALEQLLSCRAVRDVARGVRVWAMRDRMKRSMRSYQERRMLYLLLGRRRAQTTRKGIR